MASTSQPHSSFPARPYGNTLHNRSNNPAAATSRDRENARLERERQERERAQREAQQAGAGNPMNSLTDEQKEEINEAVSAPP